MLRSINMEKLTLPALVRVSPELACERLLGKPELIESGTYA